MSRKYSGKFIILPQTGEIHGVYQLTETVDGVPQAIGHDHAPCKCCGKPMHPVLDVLQMGFWDDNYKTYLVCDDCFKAVEYNYQLSRIEPVKKSTKKVKANNERI